jgi:hypothetical protein
MALGDIGGCYLDLGYHIVEPVVFIFACIRAHSRKFQAVTEHCQKLEAHAGMPPENSWHTDFCVRRYFIFSHCLAVYRKNDFWVWIRRNSCNDDSKYRAIGFCMRPASRHLLQSLRRERKPPAGGFG